tara:strand:+ start:426 stop:560 length:135 start_codon:yes stop_codon:yes gene_type:complete
MNKKATLTAWISFYESLILKGTLEVGGSGYKRMIELRKRHSEMT